MGLPDQTSPSSRKAPQCPLDPEMRAWVEYRMQWLTDEFGSERLLTGLLVEPTVRFFPDTYRGTVLDAMAVMKRVCEFMQVDPAPLKLQVFNTPQRDFDAWTGDASGLYDARQRSTVIWINDWCLNDPYQLTAVLAHEIAHVLLLGGGRVSVETPDHEPLTDLTTVFLGLGLFTANSVVVEQKWRYATAWTSQIGQQGYLHLDTCGYALALFAWVRGEDRPPWQSYLRPDLRRLFHQSLRFLTSGGESRFTPESAQHGRWIDAPVPYPRPINTGTEAEPERHDDDREQLQSEINAEVWIDVVCDDCGETMSFHELEAGTTQECDACGNYLDVPHVATTGTAARLVSPVSGGAASMVGLERQNHRVRVGWRCFALAVFVAGVILLALIPLRPDGSLFAGALFGSILGGLLGCAWMKLKTMTPP